MPQGDGNDGRVAVGRRPGGRLLAGDAGLSGLEGRSDDLHGSVVDGPVAGGRVAGFASRDGPFSDGELAVGRRGIDDRCRGVGAVGRQPVADCLLDLRAGRRAPEGGDDLSDELADAVDRLELGVAPFDGEFGEFPGGDVQVDHDRVPVAVAFEAAGPHDEPAALVGAVAGVLHRERAGVPLEDRPDAAGSTLGVLVVVPLADFEVVDADRVHRALQIVGLAEGGPGPVGVLDRPLVVEDCDLRREEVEGRPDECVEIAAGPSWAARRPPISVAPDVVLTGGDPARRVAVAVVLGALAGFLRIPHRLWYLLQR